MIASPPELAGQIGSRPTAADMAATDWETYAGVLVDGGGAAAAETPAEEAAPPAETPPV